MCTVRRSEYSGPEVDERKLAGRYFTDDTDTVKVRVVLGLVRPNHVDFVWSNRRSACKVVGGPT